MNHKKMSPTDIQQQLIKDNFKNQRPTQQLADPIVDTPIELTLDQLRTYEHNPRKSTNPLYQEIKESIRARGLDQPPTVTKRPGEKHYIIRNGGNTRLKALKELYQETGNERFYKIKCIFKPWEGEISTLVGHLVENELHGELMFIDKAIAITNMRDFYTQHNPKSSGKPYSLREMADYLKKDGYPISHPLVGKMFECVEYLLPSIPDLLYGGLGRPRIEDLLILKNVLKKIWAKYIEMDSISSVESDDENQSVDEGFLGYWTTALSKFNDIELADFNLSRVKDELLEELTFYTGQGYNLLELDFLEITKSKSKEAVINPVPTTEPPSNPITADTATIDTIQNHQPTQHAQDIVTQQTDQSDSNITNGAETQTTEPYPAIQPNESTFTETQNNRADPTNLDTDVNRHVIEPVKVSDKVQKINQEIDKQLGGDPIDFITASTTAIPVQAGGGLSEVTDLWYIPQQLNDIDALRNELYLLASDLAVYGNYQPKVIKTNEGLGFGLNAHAKIDNNEHTQAIAMLLMTLLKLHPEEAQADISLALFNQLLMGGFEIKIGDQAPKNLDVKRLPDILLIKLFRFIRLTRRLVDLINNQ